jgi:hypothetical protein
VEKQETPWPGGAGGSRRAPGRRSPQVSRRTKVGRVVNVLMSGPG